jgi:SAM-dependent methyltransferase
MNSPDLAALKVGADQRCCPVCLECLESRILGDQDGFCWRRCSSCGCRFVDRNPTREELESLYGSYYAHGNLEIPSFIQQRLSQIVRSFESYRLKQKILDVGFGAGGILTMAQANGWECWGTEIAPQALAFGRARGWRVLEGDFASLEVPEEAFDVVCLVEVLEHLEQPSAYLRRAWKALRPGGALWLTTPNGASANSRLLGTTWSIYSAPEHLQLFTAPALYRLLRQVGFARMRIRTDGLNPAELWHRLFGRKEARVDRVTTGFALNERLSSGRGPRLAKSLANAALNLMKLGDTLKALAVKPLEGPQ